MLFNKTKQVRIHWPVYVQFHFRTSVSALKKKTSIRRILSLYSHEYEYNFRVK